MVCVRAVVVSECVSALRAGGVWMSSSSSALPSVERKAVKLQWQRWLSAAVEADVWGQADEAQSLYARVCHSVTDTLPHLHLSTSELDTLTRLRHCLALRAEQLTHSTGALLSSEGEVKGDGGAERGARAARAGGGGLSTAPTAQPQLSLDDMKRLRGVVDDLFSSTAPTASTPMSPVTSAAATAAPALSPFPVHLSPAALARLPTSGAAPQPRGG